MTTITVTIGWTQSDMPRYSSFDGYEPGARQHTEDVEVDVTEWLDAGGAVAVLPEYVADCAFDATNNPGRVGPVALQIREALAARGFNGSASGHYSLSVGDTVTVSEVTLACARFGWDRVVLAPATV